MREVDAPAGDWFMRCELMKFWTPESVPEVCRMTGKIRYARKRDAVATSHARMHCRKKPARVLRVYECPLCGGWHITHRSEFKGEGKR